MVVCAHVWCVLNPFPSCSEAGMNHSVPFFCSLLPGRLLLCRRRIPTTCASDSSWPLPLTSHMAFM